MKVVAMEVQEVQVVGVSNLQRHQLNKILLLYPRVATTTIKIVSMVDLLLTPPPCLLVQ